MRKAYFGWALFLCLFMGLTPARAEVSVIFAYQDIDNTPFQVGDGLEVPPSNRGVAVEQILALENTLGIKVVLKRYPWKRALMMMKSGNVDGVFNASYKKEREEFGRYPLVSSTNGPLLDRNRRSYTNSYSFFVHQSQVNDWRNVQVSQINKDVHVPLGFSVADDLRMQGVSVVEVSDIKRYANLLNQRRIAALALLTPSGMALLSQSRQFENIEVIKPAISEKDYYLMLSHQFVAEHPELAEKVWDTVADFRKSNAYISEFNKYFLAH